MTPEKEAELLTKIDHLLELSARQALEISEIRGDLKAVNATIGEQMACIKSTYQIFTYFMKPYNKMQEKPKS